MAQKNRKKQGKRAPAYSADSMIVCLIAGLLLIALGVLIFLANTVNMTGDVFLGLRQLSRGLTGALAVLLPVIPVWGGVLTIWGTQRKPPVRPFVLSCVLYVLVCTAATLLTIVGSDSLMDYIARVNISQGRTDGMADFLVRSFEFGADHGVGGGLLGMAAAWPAWKVLGAVPGGIIAILLIVAVLLCIVRPDFRGMAAGIRQKQEARRVEREQLEQQQKQQELLWQQEQMRIQQEQYRLQQQAMQQQMAQQQMMQQAMQQQQMQQPAPDSWEHMMPPGAENWNAAQGFGQDMQERPVYGQQPAQQPRRAAQMGPAQPMEQPVQQPRASRKKQQEKPAVQIGFQTQPEADSYYPQMQPREDAQANQGKKKRTGLFRREEDQDPVAIPRRRGLFDRLNGSEDEDSDVPDFTYVEEEPVFASEQEAPVRQEPAKPAPVKAATARNVPAQAMPAQAMPVREEPDRTMSAKAAPVCREEPAEEPPAPEGSFLARLRAAKAAAGMPVPEAPAKAAEPAPHKARKDVPSGWSAGEKGAPSWMGEEDARPVARSARSGASRGAAPAEESSVARPGAKDGAQPASRQKPAASWADTPPWEDSPEYYEVEQPDAVVRPVVTSKKPEGAWEPELKLQPRKVSAAAQMAKPMFDEPEDVPYVFPTMDLLKAPEPQVGVSEEEDALRSRRLENTLQSFRVPAKVRHITHGPAISRFELELAAGIKVSKVTDLNRNIAMNMEVKSVRIEAPIPGKPLVGVEVPNRQRATVTLREVLESDVMRKATKPLVVALGKDIAGTPIVCDLAKMPHLLIAGATGSGKSVCINTIINSLLYRCSPKDVRLILVDPKVVELQCYNGIPHLLIPVVSDPHKASGALAWAVGEMMDRYKRFQEAGVRAIDGYNENIPEGGEKMPRIVIVIEELADLMMTCKKDVEERICRLAQLARAAGIHLIVATQRPSVDVITGLIKANIPSRIAFKVSSNVDSRTILDRIGAEQLLGYGDMLYMPTGEFSPTRVQGCFLSDPEVNRITDFIRENCPADYDPQVLEELERLQSESDGPSMPDLSGGGDDDYAAGDGSLLAQCIEMAVNDGQVSTSLIQRRLKLGYARAGRLVDEMEKRGIITQKDGAKPRMCLISREEFEQMKASGVLDVM